MLSKIPKIYWPTCLLLLPFPVSADVSLQSSLAGITDFLGDSVIPFLLALAFLFFVINVVRFFIFQSHNEDGRKKAKGLAIYSISAFVIIVVFWGIINLLASSIGLDGCSQPENDYKLAQPGYAGPPAPGC